jgi:hypothetical protein
MTAGLIGRIARLTAALEPESIETHALRTKIPLGIPSRR